MQTLAIKEEMTIFTAGEQKTLLLAFLDSGDDLEIDLANVVDIDSAGLQLLILIKREAAQRGKTLRFIMHSKEVLALLELANLTTAFGDQVVLAHNEA
ncbi:MAG: STAS domain-containing protein [Methylomonas sp.]